MGAEQPDVENIISIYPNPANDLLKINTKDIEIEQLKLFNLQGQQLESLNFNSKDVINVSNLNSGIYILKILSLIAEQVFINLLRNKPKLSCYIKPLRQVVAFIF